MRLVSRGSTVLIVAETPGDIDQINAIAQVLRRRVENTQYGRAIGFNMETEQFTFMLVLRRIYRRGLANQAYREALKKCGVTNVALKNL